MRKQTSGFTLIELLVVISIIGVLAATLIGPLVSTTLAANVAADAGQLRTHATWFKLYERAHGHELPRVGGHKFVLSTWTSGVFHHSEEELDMYFSPGSRDNDPDYRRARDQIEIGKDPWPTLASVTSLDTHYAGRAKSFLRTATHAGEALMATDNEGGWTFADGSLNVLLTGGKVRSYSYQDLQKRFGLGKQDKNVPVQTWGPASIVPELQRLDR